MRLRQLKNAPDHRPRANDSSLEKDATAEFGESGLLDSFE